MKSGIKAHTFHIPVMGTAFSIDTPVKIAHYGISSVISIVDDLLIEKVRKFYCEKFDLPFQAIVDSDDDPRAKRITAYLDVVDKIVSDKFQQLKEDAAKKGDDFEKYISMLPDFSEIKQKFAALKKSGFKDVEDWVQKHLYQGSIDVNIMTKVDGATYNKDKTQRSNEYNLAHSALRGFANSSLTSSIILSAGLNPRLYGYLQEFEDFYPDEKGYLKKQIILKVSDYRSALIQGKFLAKRGMWVSEYRIESGLNCGGHAFATDGFLIGPILEEFKLKRHELSEQIFPLYIDALKAKERVCPASSPEIRVTMQGGVGTAKEQTFLMEHYELDAIGWGTPFLLVPEVTNVDEGTLSLLTNAKEEDLYLSNISPLGVPFNSLRGNTKDKERTEFADKGRPGSPCPKKYLESTTEFTETPICTASRQYQHLKIKELDEQGLGEASYQQALHKIVDRSCLCVGLGTAILMNEGLDMKREGKGVSICPGPNMAYFSTISTFKEMVDHIYGRANVITRTDRPNLFIKELGLYVDYLKNRAAEATGPLDRRQDKYFKTFRKNMDEGIEYYEKFLAEFQATIEGMKSSALEQLEALKQDLHAITLPEMAKI